MLTYPFMQRALLAGIILAALLAYLGTFVVLKKMAFFADGIAHASLSGVAVGVIAAVKPLVTALISAIIFAVAIHYIEKKYRLSADTSIGIIFAFGMALGVFLISMKPGYQPELISFLFGNILAIRNFDIYMIAGLGTLIFLFTLKNLKGITLICLDPETAYVAGVKVETLQLALNIVLSIAVVLGIRVLGIVLVSALLVIPVAAAKVFATGFSRLMLISVVFSEIIVLSGLMVAYYMDLPAGPAIVLMGTGFFMASTILSGMFKKNEA